MRIHYRFLSIMILALITACGAAAPEQTNPAQEIDAPAILPTKETAADPTAVSPTTAESYPVATPPPAAADIAGYPAQPIAPVMAEEAYPAAAGFVWMLRPLGIQCEDIGSNDLNEAKAALTAAGIHIGKAEMVDLMVCSACGCPTSTHFRIEIAESDAATAESLEWARE